MPRTKKKEKGLTYLIIQWMLIGLGVGLLINLSGADGWLYSFLVEGVFHVGGKVFMACLKMLVVPLVLVSLICGTASLENVRKLGRIGGKTLGLYLITTAVAISVAILVAILVQPGAGFNLTSDAQFTAKEAPPLSQVLIDIVPGNPFMSMSEGNMLQIIFFAILFGVAVSLSGRPGERIGAFFKDANEVVMKIVMIIMKAAPYGAFCLIAKVFAQQGFDAIAPLAKYFFVVLGVLVIHALIVYPTLLTMLTGLNPAQFFKKYKDVPLFAFSTASSNATLPITLKTTEKELGVPKSIASFTIPLGATINMDGTAIMQGVATIFISQAYGVELGLQSYLLVILTATLASIGTAGVPGVGLVMLAMVLRQAGLPVEGIGLIIGVDRLLDMTRTAVNVIGDGVVTTIVAKSEKQLSLDRFRAAASASR